MGFTAAIASAAKTTELDHHQRTVKASAAAHARETDVDEGVTKTGWLRRAGSGCSQAEERDISGFVTPPRVLWRNP